MVPRPSTPQIPNTTKHNIIAPTPTIAFSNEVEVQVGILGILPVELSQHPPQLNPNGLLIGLIAEGVVHIGKPGSCWLVHIENIGKGIPTYEFTKFHNPFDEQLRKRKISRDAQRYS